MAVELEPGFKPIKTKEDVRLAVHSVILAVAPVLILIGVDQLQWEFWTGVALGILDALLAFVLSPDGVRKFLYAASGIITGVMAWLHWGDPEFVTALIAAISTAFGSLVAAFYTPSSVATQLPPVAGVVEK